MTNIKLPKPRLGLIGQRGSVAGAGDVSDHSPSPASSARSEQTTAIPRQTQASNSFGRMLVDQRRNQSEPSPTGAGGKKRGREEDGAFGLHQGAEPEPPRRVSCADLLGLYSRSAQCLRLGRWEEAMVEAMGPNFYRKGGARWKFAIGMYLLEMHSYSECQKMLLRVSTLDAKRAKLGEQTQQALDQFVGPVRIGFVQGKGRGLIATRDISQGELLLISEPLAQADAHPSTFNPTEMLYSSLISAVTNRVMNNPCELARLFMLDDGLTTPMPNATIDVFVSEAAARNEAQQLSSWTEYRHRISAIVERNCMGSRRDGRCSSLQRMCALYLLPSLLNHSCCPNAAQVFVGSTLVVTAAQPIKAGEEITVQYFDVLTPLEERQRMCGDFKCSCDRCVFEEHVGGLVDAFMLHATASIMPVWVAVTDPDHNIVQQAARNMANRTVAIQTVVGMEKFISSLGATPQQATWLKASLFRVTETLLRCYLLADSVDRIVVKLLNQAVTTIERVCPGGVDHALWSQQAWMATAKLIGNESIQAKECKCSLDKVRDVRYKPLPEWVLSGIPTQ